MTHKEILRELASLPPEGQRQVADFIAFLQEQYKSSLAAESTELSALSEEGFIGMWQGREDMHDSTAWVRSIRESEWVRSRG